MNYKGVFEQPRLHRVCIKVVCNKLESRGYGLFLTSMSCLKNKNTPNPSPFLKKNYLRTLTIILINVYNRFWSNNINCFWVKSVFASRVALRKFLLRTGSENPTIEQQKNHVYIKFDCIPFLACYITFQRARYQFRKLVHLLP